MKRATFPTTVASIVVEHNPRKCDLFQEQRACEAHDRRELGEHQANVRDFVDGNDEVEAERIVVAAPTATLCACNDLSCIFNDERPCLNLLERPNTEAAVPSLEHLEPGRHAVLQHPVRAPVRARAQLIALEHGRDVDLCPTGL